MRVLNKKYWPYQFDMHYRQDLNVVTLEDWCYENFKSAYWRNVGRVFAFKREKDATLFMLMWGGR